MMRELSSVFVALYSIFLMILIHIVIGAFVLLHMTTWFRISGRIFGAKPLTPAMVTAANYIIWVVVSVVIIFFVTLF